MTNKIVNDLQAQWDACSTENQQLKAENTLLKQQLEAMQHRLKIALDNAYVEGYMAGQADVRKSRR